MQGGICQLFQLSGEAIARKILVPDGSRQKHETLLKITIGKRAGVGWGSMT
jgi:hypothetical protein